jgi:hypothetical protein
MKVSDGYLEVMKRGGFTNADLLVECYIDSLRDLTKAIEPPQDVIDFGFSMFCAGVFEVMTPGSKFNTKWKVQGEA